MLIKKIYMGFGNTLAGLLTITFDFRFFFLIVGSFLKNFSFIQMSVLMDGLNLQFYF